MTKPAFKLRLFEGSAVLFNGCKASACGCTGRHPIEAGEVLMCARAVTPANWLARVKRT